MKKTRNNREASLLPKLQPFFPQEGMASVAVVEDRDRHPKACIKGDIICCVAEQEVARGPITGHYTVVMEDMAEPLFVLWQAQNGAVLNRSALSTSVTGKSKLFGNRIPVIRYNKKRGYTESPGKKQICQIITRSSIYKV